MTKNTAFGLVSWQSLLAKRAMHGSRRRWYIDLVVFYITDTTLRLFCSGFFRAEKVCGTHLTPLPKVGGSNTAIAIHYFSFVAILEYLFKVKKKCFV
jgi:hypothetical protein